MATLEEFTATVTGYNAEPIKPIRKAFERPVGYKLKKACDQISDFKNLLQNAIEQAGKIQSDIATAKRNRAQGKTLSAREQCILEYDVLTKDMIAVLYLYTAEVDGDTFYGKLNAALRSRDRSKLVPWFDVLHLMMAALYRLPSYSGKLHRGMPLRLSDKEAIITLWAVTSFSTDLAVTERFCTPSPSKRRSSPCTVMTVEVCNAKQLWGLSSVPHENELVLMPGTCVQVTGSATIRGVTIVHGEELEGMHKVVPPNLAGFHTSVAEDSSSEEDMSTVTSGMAAVGLRGPAAASTPSRTRSAQGTPRRSTASAPRRQERARNSPAGDDEWVGYYVSTGTADGRRVYESARGRLYMIRDSGAKATVSEDAVEFLS